MDIRSLLETEIQDELQELGKIAIGTEEYKTSVEGLTKLLDKHIEIDRVRIDREEKIKDREIDVEFRAKEIDDDKKDRFIKNCLTGVSIVTGVGLTVWGTVKSLKFEETGTVTTIMGRGFINKLLPKK